MQAPVAGVEVDAGEPPAVRWAPAAERSRVESREFGEDLDGDPGAVELPPEVLRLRAAAPRASGCASVASSPSISRADRRAPS